PLVAGLLAAEGGVDVRAIELVALATDDFDDLAPEDLVGALAEPLEQRLVDEAIALVAIDVGDRRAERVQLSLRQRQQLRAAIDAERISYRRRHRRQVKPADRSGQGHSALCVC